MLTGAEQQVVEIVLVPMLLFGLIAVPFNRWVMKSLTVAALGTLYAVGLWIDH